MTRRTPVRLAALAGVFAALGLSAGFVLAESPGVTLGLVPDATLADGSADPTPFPAPPTAVLKFGDSTLRFGTILQPTLDVQQDPNSSGYSQNWYMRRVRFYMIGQVTKDISFFFQTDNPRTGNAGTTGPKNTGTTGFLVQDAYLQWNFGGNAIALQAGFWIVPTVRQEHTSVATFMAIDLADYVLQQNTALQGNGGRDYGIGFNGYLLDDHFHYRVGLFAGNREGTTDQTGGLGPAAAARNSPRLAGRFAYDFFDSEKGYTYMGTYLGRKKVLEVAAVVDHQGSYDGYGGDAFFDWPVGPGSVTAESDYMHYNGKGIYLPSIGEQQSIFVDAGYYFADAKLQPFALYENLNYTLAANEGKEQARYGAGLNYYIMWQNLKMTAEYEKIVPKLQPATATIKNTNRYVFQWQLYL